MGVRAKQTGYSGRIIGAIVIFLVGVILGSFFTAIYLPDPAVSRIQGLVSSDSYIGGHERSQFFMEYGYFASQIDSISGSNLFDQLMNDLPDVPQTEAIRSRLLTSYAIGSRDALEGDIRIKASGRGYGWMKTPWEGRPLDSFLYTDFNAYQSQWQAMVDAEIRSLANDAP
jgi:hypothetical protein